IVRLTVSHRSFFDQGRNSGAQGRAPPGESSCEFADLLWELFQRLRLVAHEEIKAEWGPGRFHFLGSNDFLSGPRIDHLCKHFERLPIEIIKARILNESSGENLVTARGGP